MILLYLYVAVHHHSVSLCYYLNTFAQKEK